MPAFASIVAVSVFSGGAAAAQGIQLSDVAAANSTSGIVIRTSDYSSRFSYAVAMGGDINGDGLDDVIVTSPYAFGPGPSYDALSQIYVVFGKTAGGEVTAEDIESGTGGFAISAPSADDFVGLSVSGAGDVNGDGLADIIIGQMRADPNATGRVFVVFGKASTTPIDLANVLSGTGGFVINGYSDAGQAGSGVGDAGDVNGDGKDDLIVGAVFADNANNRPGQAYVIFGKSSGTAVDIADVIAGTGGFLIQGESGFDRAGISVDGAGDVNGDRLDDLIVGAYKADVDDYGSLGGKAYVVFGKSSGTSVLLADVSAGTGGFAMIGENAAAGGGGAQGDYAGFSVSGAGDVNGDGRSDVIVGAPFFDSAGAASDGGRAYVVFGKSNTTAVELSAVAAGTGGFAIDGEDVGGNAGRSVSGAGDVNHDGKDDVIVGSRHVDTGDVVDTGRAHIVFGKANGTLVELSDVTVSDAQGIALISQETDEKVGTAVAGGGDFNGDGSDDVIVGAYRAQGQFGQIGRAYVVFGPFPGDKVWVEFIDQGMQTGTFDEPFAMVAHGVEFVPEGGEIVFKGTGGALNSSETIVINKAMRLNSVGETIRIGAP